MEDFQLMGLFVETLNALECELIVGYKKLLQVKIIEEHLFKALVRNVVVNQVENPQSLCEVLRDIEKQIIVDLTAVQLDMN
jgi:hypothetical protein